MSDLGKKFHAQKWEHIFTVGGEMIIRKPDMLVDHGARIALTLLIEEAEKSEEYLTPEDLRLWTKEILG
jgi:hypothetical protein